MKNIIKNKSNITKRSKNKMIKKHIKYETGVLLLWKFITSFWRLTPDQRHYIVETMKNIKKYRL